MVQLKRWLSHSVKLYLSPLRSDIFCVLYLEWHSSSQQNWNSGKLWMFNIFTQKKEKKNLQLIRMHSDCQITFICKKLSFNVFLCICNKCTKQAVTEIHSSFAFLLSTDLRRFDGRGTRRLPLFSNTMICGCRS